MGLAEKLQSLSMKQLAKIHKLLGLDEEYPISDYECKGNYIMHIFEKNEKKILKALKEINSKK